jgi:hypothetical protein
MFVSSLPLSPSPSPSLSFFGLLRHILQSVHSSFLK